MDYSWMPVVVAATITLLTGAIWYNPRVFGRLWLSETGLDEETLQKANMPLIFGLTYLFGLMVAVMLQGCMDRDLLMLPVHPLIQGSMIGGWIGLMLGLPVLGVIALFERRSYRYILIHAGYWVLTLGLMGGLLAWWV